MFRRLRKSESAQATIVAAIALTALIGFIGLSIDVGQLRYTKRRLQGAADAAALAAALEIQSCSGTQNCSAMQAAAQNALVENGFAGSTLVKNCATTAVSGLKLMVNNPSCALGSADPNSGKGNYVEVFVSQPQTTYFARFLGFNNVPVTARAQAARSGGANCMFALDPTGSNAITVDLLASISSSCGIMDESSASNALSCNLLAAITASQINVVGGVQNFLCSISPTPNQRVAVPSPADPLAYLAKPSVPACGTSTGSPYHGSASALNISGTATLYSDAAYCGGINILPGANVTFQPGTYVLTSSNGGATKNPGGLSIDLGTTVNGTGVTFYNYGPNGGINFTFSSFSFGGVNLVAPTSGTYSGILFFQDPQNSAGANIIGSPSWNTVLQGTYYFPKAKVTFAFSGPVSYNILVAYDIEFALLTFGSTSLTSGFASDYSSLGERFPGFRKRRGTGAVMIMKRQKISADGFRTLLSRHREEGSSVIEVAFLLPVMVLLLVGAVDFGRAYYVAIVVSSAAEAGALYGIANPTSIAGMKAAATLDSKDVPNLVATPIYGCECSDGTSAVPSCTSVPTTCTYNVVNYVEVDTVAQYAPILPYPGIPSTITLHGTSRMRAGR